MILIESPTGIEGFVLDTRWFHQAFARVLSRMSQPPVRMDRRARNGTILGADFADGLRFEALSTMLFFMLLCITLDDSTVFRVILDHCIT